MTSEEASRTIESYMPKDEPMNAKDREAFFMAIKALKQEPVLDKIKAEITNIRLTDTDGHNNNWYREPQAIINDTLRIIDKYKAESEDKE